MNVQIFGPMTVHKEHHLTWEEKKKITQILPEDKHFVSCGIYTNITFLSLYTACPRSPFTNIH